MSGFRAFLLRGNLVELAVAFIVGAAFNDVVTSFTKTLTDAIAALVGAPTVGEVLVGGVDLAPFMNAVIAFLILAAVVYFGVVVPYTKAKERLFPEPATDEEPAPAQDIVLLTEIRDALTKR